MFFMTLCRRIWKGVQTHALALIVFLFLWILLWQGDGQQQWIDVSATILVSIATVYLAVRGRALRAVPRIQWMLGFAFFLYVLFCLPLSDDIGSTVFTLFRYCLLFIVYSLFYVYSTKQTLTQLWHGLIAFGFVATLAAVLPIVSFELTQRLPSNTLLHSTSDHHPIIALLLFLYPVLFIWWMESKKAIAFFFVSFFFLASVLTFSRAGVGIEVLFSLGYVFYTIKKKKTIRRLQIGVLTLMAAFCILLFVFPYSSTNTALSSIFRQKKTSDVTIARTEYMRQAIVSFTERPLIGSGLGTFHLQSLRLENKSFAFSWFPHASPLQHLSDVGSIGAILLWGFFASVVGQLIWHIPKEKSFKTVVISSIISLGVVALFSLVDIPFLYISIALVFWAILGAVGGLCDPSPKPKGRNIFLSSTILLLCVFAYVGSVDTWFFWKENGIPVCNPLRTERITSCLQEANKQQRVFSVSYRRVVEYLHKKNPFLVALSEMEKNAGDTERAWRLCDTAISCDPFSAYTYYPCFRFLVLSRQYVRLGTAVTTLLLRVAPAHFEERILDLDLEQDIYAPVFEKILDESVPYGYVAMLYKIGLAFISTDPHRTELFWRLARDIEPDNGHLQVEYADLLAVVLGEPERAKQELLACQFHAAAARECAEWLVVGEPSPGRLESAIQKGN